MTVDAGPFSLGDVGGAGPAVLCVHGLTGTPYEVRPPAEALASAGFACHGPMLPGHGAPPEALASTPPEAWVDHVTGAYDRLAETHARVYVLGLSLGGVLALLLATLRPVAGLAVLAAPLRLRTLPRVLVPVLRRVVPFLPKRPAIADPEARRRHPGTERMPLRSVAALQGLQREVASRLHRITAPTHLIYSRRDPLVDPANAERIQRSLTGARSTLRYLDRSLHVITVDVEMHEVTRECVDFFTHLERGTGPYRRVDGGPAPP